VLKNVSARHIVKQAVLVPQPLFRRHGFLVYRHSLSMSLFEYVCPQKPVLFDICPL